LISRTFVAIISLASVFEGSKILSGEVDRLWFNEVHWAESAWIGQESSAECPERAGKSATNVRNPNSLSKETDECTKAKLRDNPTSGVDWLGLANHRARYYGVEREVLQALTMSEVTEPRETKTVFKRILFSLSFWDQLPEEKQHRVIHDLSESVPFMSDQHFEELGKICRGKAPAWRASIKAQLMFTQGGEKPWMSAIGL
jgi:hypothetical protein